MQKGLELQQEGLKFCEEVQKSDLVNAHHLDVYRHGLHRLLANTYNKLNFFQLAKRHIHEASLIIGRDTNNVFDLKLTLDFQLELAGFLKSAGFYGLGLQVIKDIEQQCDEDIEDKFKQRVMLEKAKIEAGLYKVEESLESFDKAAELIPSKENNINYGFLLSTKCSMLRRMNEEEEAFKVAEEAKKYFSKLLRSEETLFHASIDFEIGAIERGLKNYEKAMAKYKEAQKFVEAYFNDEETYGEFSHLNHPKMQEYYLKMNFLASNLKDKELEKEMQLKYVEVATKTLRVSADSG